MYRLTTISEHLLQDILDEQKKTNELLTQLLPKQEVVEAQAPVVEEAPKKRSKKGV